MVRQTVGKYRVVSRLGRDGTDTVYKAVHETLEREVAIKCLNPDVRVPGDDLDRVIAPLEARPGAKVVRTG